MFQALVNDVLRDVINQNVFVYLDDILIFSDTMEEHIDHVRLVLQRLLENRLFAKAEKCEFHRTTVQFLGFIVSRGKLEMDPAKTDALRTWPILPVERSYSDSSDLQISTDDLFVISVLSFHPSPDSLLLKGLFSGQLKRNLHSRPLRTVSRQPPFSSCRIPKNNSW